MLTVPIHSDTVRTHDRSTCVGQLIQLGGNAPGDGWWIVIRPASERQHGLAIPAMLPRGTALVESDASRN